MHNHNTIIIKDSYYENDSGEDLGYSKETKTSDDLFDTNKDAINTTVFDEDPLSINEPEPETSSSWFDSESWGDDSDSSWSSCGGD